MFPADASGGRESKVKSQKSDYTDLGVPEEWVESGGGWRLADCLQFVTQPRLT